MAHCCEPLSAIKLNRPYENENQPLESPFDRGGVEDTRLEAKAKNTKKIRGQGQGQPFRGQTLSRPRTGMLEAKDQRHKRKCSPKKKRLQKSFSGNLQLFGVARIFDWGAQTTNHMH